MTTEHKRRLLLVAAVLGAAFGAVFLWLRAEQPASTAKALYDARPRLAGGGEYVAVIKIPEYSVVCGAFRGKDFNGKFAEVSPFIVWFQTRDWFSWRDPVLLRPTPDQPGIFFGSPDPVEDAQRWKEELHKLAQERAANDYYRFSDACDRALKAQ